MLSGFDAKPLRGSKKRQARAAEVQVPTGVSLPFRGSTAPAGFLMEDGSAVSRRTYADLFAVIGTTYGVGDGSTTFNLPNPRDRTHIGAGSLYSLGATGGSKDAVVVAHTHTTSATTSSDGSHVHDLNYKSSGGSAAGSGMLRGVDTDGTANSFMAAAGAHNHTVNGTAASTGVAGTDQNLPPYLATNYIIKT